MINILRFPTQYPDEDIRSLAYRYHIESHNENFQKSYTELFAVKKYKNGVFPCNLDIFLESLCEQEETKTHFIKSHTYIPFIKPFIERSKWKKLMNEPFSFTSVLRIFDDNIKYCPECMLKDTLDYGLCYVHREHQFRYVDICITHGCGLITKCNTCDEYYAKKGDQNLALLPKCNNGHEINSSCSKVIDQFTIWVVDSFRIMIDHYDEIDAEWLNQKLIPILANSGYIELKGAILKTKIIEDMIAFFGPELLHKFGLYEKKLLEHRTITRLFNPYNFYTNIYFYLFLVKFLIGDLKKLIVDPYEYSTTLPFGKGPWVCKNKICPSFELPVITNCIRTVKQHISGQFTCTICGYSYLQRFEFLKTNNPRKGRVIEMGFLWRETVSKMILENRSLLSISKEIGSDVLTIKKYKLNILDTSRTKAEIDIKDLKDEFIKFMNSLENVIGRIEIKKLFGKGKYDKLMKNEREWMENLLPNRKRNLSKYREYPLLDEEAYESVNKAYEQLLLENPPQRITKILILKRTTRVIFSRLTMNSKKHFLKTNILLEEIAETQDSYLKRIFPLIIVRFENAPRNKTLTWSLICHKLHPAYRNASNDMKNWVLQKIEEFEEEKNSRAVEQTVCKINEDWNE